MPQALSQFREGMDVSMTCYHRGCEETSIFATLGKEFDVHPSFVATGGVGRFRWQRNARIRGFLVANVHGQPINLWCTNTACLTKFAHVLIVSMGPGRNPVIFGYESEGA